MNQKNKQKELFTKNYILKKVFLCDTIQENKSKDDNDDVY